MVHFGQETSMVRHKEGIQLAVRQAKPLKTTENASRSRFFSCAIIICGFFLWVSFAFHECRVWSDPKQETCTNMFSHVCVRVVMPVPVYITYIYIHKTENHIYIYYTLEGWDEMDGRESRCTTTNEPYPRRLPSAYSSLLPLYAREFRYCIVIYVAQAFAEFLCRRYIVALTESSSEYWFFSIIQREHT